jgi:hypothetical protein
MPGNKRDAAMLQRLLKKFGDVKLSEAQELLSRARGPGRPPKWGGHELFQILFCVELRKAVGLSPSDAKEETAKYLGLTHIQVEKNYTKSCKRYEQLFPDLPSLPHLREQLQQIKRPRPAKTKTPPNQ